VTPSRLAARPASRRSRDANLQVAHGCPWWRRILIYRALKTLDSVIAVALPGLNQNGWAVERDGGYPDCVPDEINGFHHLYEYYLASNPTFTVPTPRDRGHPWGGRVAITALLVKRIC
jgi:glutathionyl-hydroquinone reductase